MYLTPPYSHSYGLHSDVMDAFMVQLVGSKHWRACEKNNCTTLSLSHGDVLYLPMHTKHAAWTSTEMSAHLTVNVERQFYVWGSILQAMAARLLLPDQIQTELDGLDRMDMFGMEDQSQMQSWTRDLGEKLPLMMSMPRALLAYTMNGSALNGGVLFHEWELVLSELSQLKLPGEVHITVGEEQRRFESGSQLIAEVVAAGQSAQMRSLSWVSNLIVQSIDTQMQHVDPALDARVRTEEESEEPEQLSRIANERALKIGQRGEL